MGAASARIAPPQRARANLASYFSGDDYPAAALRGKNEGIVGFRLAIGPTGRVPAARSAARAALPASTPPLATSCARAPVTRPGRNYLGNRVNGTDLGRVVWRLSDDPFDPSLEAEASAAGPRVASPKPPRARARAGPRPRPRPPPK